MPDCYTCGGNAFCDCIRMPNGEKVANPYWNNPVSGPNIQSVSFPAQLPLPSPPPSSEIAGEITVAQLRESAAKLGYRLIKIEPGKGWHPNDGPCSFCGVEEGVDCLPNCSA